MLEEFNKITNLIKELENEVKKLKNENERLKKRDIRRCDFYTHKIVKEVIKHICSGLDENNAVFLTAESYKGILTEEHIKIIWSDSKRHKNSLKLYARIFMAHTMKKSGYSRTEIANAIGCSLTSVNKLLESDFFI